MELIVKKYNRIDILDAIRGIAILSMVVFHALYDMEFIFGYPISLFEFFEPVEPLFAGAFILLSGVSSRFSHSNFKRGLRVIALAALITIGSVTFSRFISPGEEIYFGILHFMGAAIIIYALTSKLLDKIPFYLALALWLFLFAVTYSMPSTYTIGFTGLIVYHLPASLTLLPWLFALGVPSGNFFSADYFPLIPWLFLFLAGTVIGQPIKEKKLPERFYTFKVPFLASAGRNTLLIYVVHQPLVYCLLYVIQFIFGVKGSL